MVERTATSREEPEQKSFKKPSENMDHLFQITEVFDYENPHPKISTDENTVIVKLEVEGGEEEGRTMLHWVNLDDQWAGFFRTKIFLKCIGEPYKGDDFPIMSDNWQGRKFYADVVHTEDGKYANVNEFNIDKSLAIEQYRAPVKAKTDKDDNEIAWDD
jgi:hypothetical protein